LDYKSPESNKGKKRFPLDVDALFPNIKEKESKRWVYYWNSSHEEYWGNHSGKINSRGVLNAHSILGHNNYYGKL
jgi:hypothetical protein